METVKNEAETEADERRRERGGTGRRRRDGATLASFAANTVLTDPALDPERIAERSSVSWEEIDAASKRLFLEVSGFPPCAEDG